MYKQTRTSLEAIDLFCAQRQCYENNKYSSRTLEEFEKNPFLQLTLPLLQNIMEVSDSKLVEYVEIAIILSDYDSIFIELLFHNIADLFDNDTDSYKFKTYTDFIILLLEYNNESIRPYKIGYEFRTDEFKEVESVNIPFEKIYPNDSVYEILLLDTSVTPIYFNPHNDITNIENRFLSVYDLFLFDFVKLCKGKFWGISLRKIYFDLYERAGCIQSQFLDDASIHMDDLIERKHNPIAFCFLVSYVKFKGLFNISNELILNNISLNYINAFRDFWWLCEICSNYENYFTVTPMLEHSYSLRHYVYLTVNEIGLYGYIRENIKGNEFQGGRIDLKPGIEYLTSFQIKKEISTELKIERDLEKSVVTINDVGNTITSFCSFIHPDIDKSKHTILIDTIRRYLLETEGKGKKTANIVYAAYNSDILVKKPTYESLLEIGLEFNDIGTRAGYYNQIKDSNYEGATKDKTRIKQYEYFCNVFIDLREQLLLDL